MSDRMTTLPQWRKLFSKLDRCPWPGPRPMTKDDRELLIGRAADADRFSTEVQGNRLVILTGESGVGKSSLLNAGLMQELESNGFLPLLCSDWSWSGEGIDDPEVFVGGKVRDQLPPEIVIDDPAGPGLCARLDEEFGDTAVLILDQFEELIRYQPELFARMVDWILRINHHHAIRVVLSLRSEYSHKLKRLNASVRPFTMARYDLEPLSSPDVVRKIVESGNRDGVVIDDEAIGELLDTWRAVAPAEGTEGGLGLLHLQATLYTLHDRTAGAIGLADVRAMAADAEAIGLFRLGLESAVSVKLQRCFAACLSADAGTVFDRPLVTGTSGIIRQLVGHLSSGGYKLVNEEWDLAQKGLARELGVLAHPPEAESLFRALAGFAVASLAGDGPAIDDPLSASRAVVEAAAGLDSRSVPVGISYLADLGVDPAPWMSDPEDMSSGPMLGMMPRAVLIEELRRFVFAMAWLRESALVRTSSPAPGQTMVSLIHDGLGPALERWAAQQPVTSRESLVMLTAARGEIFDWRPQPDDLDGLIGGDGPSTIVNMRWQSGRISANFHDVVFVNCDFRGSRFERCSFRGTVFVNCLLDGVMFAQCEVLGGVLPADEAFTEDLPGFVIPVPAETVRTLDHYRETATGGDELYSVTSGVPAVPWKGETRNVLGWQPQTGGLTMYGGRLSSLMVRNCFFDDDGVLAFRHIAGSSLDIVEQMGGTVEVFGSAIRGLTITRKVSDTRPSDPFRLVARRSKLADTWLGDRLNGSARFEDCVLWQLMNVTDRDPSATHTFDVEIHNCSYYGLVNVSAPINSTETTSMSQDGIDGREAIVASTMQMDYRRVPARAELDQRANLHR